MSLHYEMYQGPMVLAPPPCPQPAFHLRKNLSQNVSLIKEVKKLKKKKGKAVKRKQIIIM